MANIGCWTLFLPIVSQFQSAPQAVPQGFSYMSAMQLEGKKAGAEKNIEKKQTDREGFNCWLLLFHQLEPDFKAKKAHQAEVQHADT